MNPVPSPILPARWAEILDSVQQALAQAEAEATRSAASLTTAAPALLADEAWQHALAQRGEQGRQLLAGPAAAELLVCEVEAALQASETALRQWLERAEALRRKLANGAGVSV
jgi:hypothetical protein